MFVVGHSKKLGHTWSIVSHLPVRGFPVARVRQVRQGSSVTIKERCKGLLLH